MAKQLSTQERFERLEKETEQLAEAVRRLSVGIRYQEQDNRERCGNEIDRMMDLLPIPVPPEEKKPPAPLSFDDWIKAGEVFYPAHKDVWNASRRNTKKDMSRLLMSNDFREAAVWLEEYNWGTSDG